MRQFFATHFSLPIFRYPFFATHFSLPIFRYPFFATHFSLIKSVRSHWLRTLFIRDDSVD
ncbi:hypothetical protein EFP45_10690 [Lactiplantibacillus pentosus]|nr:hypothetical protein [Lactiplantibacillus pentosus]